MRTNAKKIVYMGESGVTAKLYRHRTTIPSEVFHALGLRDRDRLRWALLRDGTVIVEKAGK
jgi:bifunctional DNA-binding transcriptional regulator/antitoxin component of YhaV-PrlF toxin-antitoxin module